MNIAMIIGGYILMGIATATIGARMEANDIGAPLKDDDLAFWWNIGLVLWPLFVVGYVGYKTVMGIVPAIRAISTPARIRKAHQAQLEGK